MGNVGVMNVFMYSTHCGLDYTFYGENVVLFEMGSGAVHCIITSRL